MKKIYLSLAVLAMSSASAWSIGWGIFKFPSYDYSSQDALTKFDDARNGELEYVFGLQSVSTSVVGQPSQFGALLAAWDAKADWKTCRGTLQTIWGRLGEPAPAAGWPSVQKQLTLEDIQVMWPNYLPD